MKSKSLILAALAGAILATGCKQSNTADENTTGDTNVTSTAENIKNGVTNAWEKTEEVTTNALADVKEGTTNAWANTKYAATNAWTNIKESLGSTEDYTYDKKDAFVTGAQADLNALDQKIQALSGNADASLHDKRAALDQKLTDVKNATQDNWNDAKTAFENSYADVKNSVKQEWTGSVTNSMTSSSMMN
jgi:hypothetical protein